MLVLGQGFRGTQGSWLPIVHFCRPCECALWLARDPRRAGLTCSDLEGSLKAVTAHLDQLAPGRPAHEQAGMYDSCFKPLALGWSATQRGCAHSYLIHSVYGFAF